MVIVYEMTTTEVAEMLGEYYHGEFCTVHFYYELSTRTPKFSIPVTYRMNRA